MKACRWALPSKPPPLPMPARACRPLCPAVPRTCLPAPACVRSASWQAVLFGDHHPLEVGRAGAAGGAEGSSACTPAAKPLAPCAEAVRLSGNRVAGPGGERPSLRCVCAPRVRGPCAQHEARVNVRWIFMLSDARIRHTAAKTVTHSRLFAVHTANRISTLR
jgi:hypothetical protein